MNADLRKIWSVFFLIAFIVLLGSCEKNGHLEPGPDPINYSKSFGGDGPDGDDSDDSDDDNSGDDSDDITDDEDDQDDGDITDDEDDQDDSESRSNAVISLEKE